MPSQHQLRWSELRVGITIIVALVTLAVLIFLMSGTAGIFSSKVTLYVFFANAEGLKVGAPVRLQGVDIGNVKEIHVVADRRESPVKVTLRVNTSYQSLVRKDSRTTIATAGVLGESFIDLDSRAAIKSAAQNGDELPAVDTPGLEDVVRSSQGTLQNMDSLVRRLDRIIASIESGKGTMGAFIKDPSFFNRANSILGQMQTIVNDVSNGKGTIGQFFADDTLYRKFASDVDKIDKMLDEMQQGKGTLGKLLKDDSIYNNTNQTIAKANKLMDDISNGHGALQKFTKDEEFARKLDNVVTRLSNLSDKLDTGNGTASLLLKDPSMYNNTDQLLVETRGLIKAIREDPKKYLTIHFRIF